jgi:adenylate cyclase
MVRRLRLWSGLILFTYLTTHFANHALGLVSLRAMGEGRVWFLALWNGPLGTVALYGALLTHFSLALTSLYRRRHLRMPAWEAAQLVLGLMIPPMLAYHVVGTRVASAMFGVVDSYERIVLSLWYVSPASGVRQVILFVVAWLHACIGLHFWLRLRPWYPQVLTVLFAVSFLLPIFALLGFAKAGQEVTALAQNPVWVLTAAPHPPTVAQGAFLVRVREMMIGIYAAAVGLVLVARAIRREYERRWTAIRISYPDGRVVTVSEGFTVLEASRFAGIPHASVCGGRGRCSTCRIRVTRGGEFLASPAAEELRVLRRVGAPPNVRLACQLRPTHDLAVTPLLPASVRPHDTFVEPEDGQGKEREIAVLFADLRAFTLIAENKLPYDVVFILNRYFEAVGGAIKRAGGIPNQFTGDGVMALFGMDSTPEEGCRRALLAAGEIVEAVSDLSRTFANELPAPLRIGIGIHAGPAVIGLMGYGESVDLTAVGDTVHVASRLEQLTKDYGCELVITEEVARRAGVDVSGYPQHLLTLRNRATPLTIRVIQAPRQLTGALT